VIVRKNDSDCRLIDNKYSDSRDRLEVFYSNSALFLKVYIAFKIKTYHAKPTFHY